MIDVVRRGEHDVSVIFNDGVDGNNQVHAKVIV